MDNKKVKDKNKIKKRILYIIIIISAITAAASAAGLALELYENGQARSLYTGLSADFIMPAEAGGVIGYEGFQAISEMIMRSAPGTNNRSASTGNARTEIENASSGDEVNPEISAEGDTDNSRNTAGGYTVDYTPDSAGLRAWIKCGGTVIDYPVMQCDDNEYYLSHLPNGVKNKIGSIYLDYRNSPDFTDKNTVIYGHHMKNGDMFTTLKYYNSQSFYESHSKVHIYTPEKNIIVELFAGYIVDADTEYLTLYFRDSAAFEGYLAEIRGRSVFSSNVEVNADDLLVSLVTCSYELENARMVVVGKIREYY